MPSEGKKMLEFTQYQKSDKAPFIIYEDFECIIKEIDEYKNNPENSYPTKRNNEVINIKSHMKMPKSVISVEEKLKINIQKIKIL